MENKFTVLGSRWQEMQGKAVTKIPREIIERDEIIQSLLEDVDDIYAEKDGRAKGDRLVRNIKKLIKVNDQEKEKVGLQRLEYLPGATKAVKPPGPRDRVTRKTNARTKIRNALNPSTR